MTDSRLQFRNLDQIRTLFGAQDRNLRRLREILKIDAVVRGDELHLRGEPRSVERAVEILSDLRTIVERQGVLPDDEFDRALFRAQFDAGGDSLEIDVFHKGRKINPMTPGQRTYVRAMQKHDLVFCGGPAGSGKTFLAVAMAVNALRRELVRKIILVRPAVEAGEKLGFLPGDMFAKVNPYLRPLLDALADILDFDHVQRYLERDVIEILPMAFMRGRTLNNTFIILDEAQNTTVTQMKMFLTRMGNHSKIVVTGDTTQTDIPDHITSGLNDAMIRLRGIPGVGMMELSGEDIVRHPLVRRIVAAYEADNRIELSSPPKLMASEVVPEASQIPQTREPSSIEKPLEPVSLSDSPKEETSL